MISSLIFGDIFAFNGQEYIFLARTENITYAAEILDIERSNKLETFVNSQIYKGKDIVKGPIYCYVKLMTKDFKDRCAHLHNSGKNNNGLYFEKLNIQIETSDLKNILTEILESKFVAIELKDLVRGISL